VSFLDGWTIGEQEKVAVPEVTGGAANRLREDKITKYSISIKLGSPESAIKLFFPTESPGCESQGKTEEVMRIRTGPQGIRVHASVGVAVMAASSCWVPRGSSGGSKRQVHRKEHSWKLSAVSESLPGKIEQSSQPGSRATRLSAGLPMSPSSKSIEDSDGNQPGTTIRITRFPGG